MKKRKRIDEVLSDLNSKHTIDEKYSLNRIYKNKFDYLKIEKKKQSIILPNVKSILKPSKDKKKPMKNEEIGINKIDFGESCNYCNVYMQIIIQESILSCPRCGSSKPIPLYSIPMAESDFFVPRALQNKARIIDWLQNVQGDDSGDAKPDVVHQLCLHIKKYKKSKLCNYEKIIKDEFHKGGKFLSYENTLKRLENSIPNLDGLLKEINHTFIRTCFEEMKSEKNSLLLEDDESTLIKKCYEKTPKYASALNGLKPLHFTNYQEEKIKHMYSLAYPEYEKSKGKYKNWPGGYAYFLKCVCALLGYDEFLDHFECFSNNMKIKEEREMFRKKVWSQLHWEYFSMEHPLSKIQYM